MHSGYGASGTGGIFVTFRAPQRQVGFGNGTQDATSGALAVSPYGTTDYESDVDFLERRIWSPQAHKRSREHDVQLNIAVNLTATL